MRRLMVETHIGKALGRSRIVTWLSAALLAAAVVAHSLIVLYGGHRFYFYSSILASAAIVCLLFLADGDAASLGLVLRPRSGFRYWGVTTAVLGIGLILLLGLLCVVQWLAHKPPRFALAPASALQMLPNWCVYAPLMEELLYRLGLCAPLAANQLRSGISSGLGLPS